MKRNFVIASILVMAALFLSSCKKDETPQPQSPGYSVEDATILLKSDKYKPTESYILELYTINNNLKSINSDLKVGFSIPSNIVIPLPEGGFELVHIWSIIETNILRDKGVYVHQYSEDLEPMGYKFYIGWTNEYCQKVEILNDIADANYYSFSFTYETTHGVFSFADFYYGNPPEFLWLPQMPFGVTWTAGDNQQIAFGDVVDLDPTWDLEIQLRPVLNITVTHVLSVSMDGITNEKSMVTLWIQKAGECGSAETVDLNLVNPSGSYDIPLMYEPGAVTIRVIHFDNYMPADPEYYYKVASFTGNGGIYVLEDQVDISEQAEELYKLRNMFRWIQEDLDVIPWEPSQFTGNLDELSSQFLQYQNQIHEELQGDIPWFVAFVENNHQDLTMCQKEQLSGVCYSVLSRGYDAIQELEGKSDIYEVELPVDISLEIVGYLNTLDGVVQDFLQ